jgi:hypothetical protein
VITAPIPGSGHSKFVLPHNRNLAKVLERQAQITVNSKYRSFCHNSRMSFTPFVMESTGFIHQEGMRLHKIFEKRNAEVWKINDEGILNYFTRCLLCVLQKANASNINKRYMEIIAGPHTIDQNTIYRSTYIRPMIIYTSAHRTKQRLSYFHKDECSHHSPQDSASHHNPIQVDLLLKIK